MSRKSIAPRGVVRRKTTGRRGANAIEFALTFPVFLFAFVAAVDIGFYGAARAQVADAVRAGCQSGAFQSDADHAVAATTAIETGLEVRGVACDGCVETVLVDSSPQMLKCTVSTPHDAGIGVLGAAPDNVGYTSWARVEVFDV